MLVAAFKHKFIIPGKHERSTLIRGAPRCLESQGPGRIVAEIPCIPEPMAGELANAICFLPSTGLGVERLQRGAPRVHLLPSFECSRLSQCQTQPQWLVAQEWLLKRCLRMPRTLTRCRATGCGLQKTLVQVITCYN